MNIQINIINFIYFFCHKLFIHLFLTPHPHLFVGYTPAPSAPLLPAVMGLMFVPGKQCVSLSMVVAIFLCCRRHCLSSSIDVRSYRRGNHRMINVINIFAFNVTSSESKTKLSKQDTHLLAVILELLIGLGHLTLRKTKQPIIQA